MTREQGDGILGFSYSAPTFFQFSMKFINILPENRLCKRQKKARKHMLAILVVYNEKRFEISSNKEHHYLISSTIKTKHINFTLGFEKIELLNIFPPFDPTSWLVGEGKWNSENKPPCKYVFIYPFTLFWSALRTREMDFQVAFN